MPSIAFRRPAAPSSAPPFAPLFTALPSVLPIALLFASLPGTVRAEVDVQITVDVGRDVRPISPLIYGTNFEGLGASEGVTLRRSGGNRLTGYNWENNASHAGADWQHSSDNFLGASSTPGKAFTDHHDKSLQMGAQSIITLQAAGYVSKDKNGTVSEAEKAPSARWAKVVFAKGAAFTAAPNAADGEVYMDEAVDFLVKKYGAAGSERGIRNYSVDNEPGLWPHTHPRIHPDAPTCAELIQKTADLSRAVKQVDPQAQIFGGVFYGWADFAALQAAPDWNAIKAAGKYYWFIDHFLAEMKKNSDAAGKRLLDVLDVHWYSEHTGDKRITDGGATSAADQAARVQAPRSLWDSTFVEKSWISQTQTVKAGNTPGPVVLLDRLQASIDKYYPGTRLAITEYSHGDEGHVTGGLATADFLGVVGRRGVHAATYWPLESSTQYVGAAFRLFRNFDGQGSAFPDWSAPAQASDRAAASAYAAFRSGGDAVHLIVINKHATETLRAAVTVNSSAALTGGQVFGFDGSGATLSGKPAVASITGNAFTYSLPPMSAYHFVLKTSSPLPTSIRFPGMKPLAGRVPGYPKRSAVFTVEGRAVDGRRR